MNLETLKNMQADAAGIVVLNIEGRERKFVKEKLIRYLETNEAAAGHKMPPLGDYKLPPVTAMKIPKERKPRTPKKEMKPEVKKNQDRVKVAKGKSQCKPVIAILPDGTKKEFDSGMDASKGTGVYKSGVCRVANGMIPHVNNIVFRFKNAM